MTPIFLTQIDDCVIDFLIYNTPLQEISKKHEVILATSGDQCKEVLPKYYPNATFIHCPVNSYNWKAFEAIKYLKQHNKFDVLIRTCPDAVVFRPNKLLRMVENTLKDVHGAVGVIYKRKGKISHIRGGCNAVTKSVINQIDFDRDSKKSFDAAYTHAIQATDAKLYHKPLFEISKRYSNQSPVWHPPKLPNDKRAIVMKDMISLIKEGKN